MKLSLGLGLGLTATAAVAPAASGFNIEQDTESNILAATPDNYTMKFGTDTKNLYVFVTGDGWSIYDNK